MEAWSICTRLVFHKALPPPHKMSKFKYLYFPLPGHPILQQNADPAKKRLLDELVKKYRGDEGERLAVLPLLEWLGDEKETNRDATVICSQKSMLTLFHQQMEKELSGDLQLPEPVDKKIAVVEKVAESVGLLLDIHAIELDVENLMVEFLGQLGSQSVTAMMSRIQNLPVPEGFTDMKEYSGGRTWPCWNRSSRTTQAKQILTCSTISSMNSC